MKKIFLFAIVALVFSSCADMSLTPEQKKRKQSIMSYFDQRVGKCEEVIIKYAKLDYSTVCDIYDEEVEKYNKNAQYPQYWATSEFVRVIYRKDKDSYRVNTMNLVYFDNNPPKIFPADPNELYIYRSDKIRWTTIPVKVSNVK